MWLIWFYTDMHMKHICKLYTFEIISLFFPIDIIVGYYHIESIRIQRMQNSSYSFVI